MAKKKKVSIVSPSIKRHLVSASISFITAFSVAILPLIDHLTIENVGMGAGFAVLFTALRAGIKAVFEGIASKAY